MQCTRFACNSGSDRSQSYDWTSHPKHQSRGGKKRSRCLFTEATRRNGSESI